MWLNEKLLHLKKLNPFADKLKLGQADGIYSPEEFAAILGRERARADRSQGCFSLVLFEFRDIEDTDALYRQLLSVVARRIRVVDDLGWFQVRTLAVSLPYTNQEGAGMFAESTLKAMDELASRPHHEIYTYPEHWMKSGQEPSHDKLRGAVKPEAPTPQDTGGETQSSDDGMTFHRLLPVRTQKELSAHIIRNIPPWKRFMDLLGAITGFALVFPFLIPVAIYIKLVSRGPFIFKQERVGFNGETFNLYKLRTMHVGSNSERHRKFMAQRISGAETDQPVLKLDDDPGIIPLGTIIRKLCLDEFPQLVNVFKGEMSLVGPRPPIPYEVKEYLRWHSSRFDTVPGLTGLWQVSGKNNLTFREMVGLDIAYIRKRSFFLDISILIRTPLAIITQCLEGMSKKKPEQQESVDSLASPDIHNSNAIPGYVDGVNLSGTAGQEET